MLQNISRKDRINQYIANNPDCLQGKTKFSLLNDSYDLDVYQLNLDLIYPNDTNGRISTEKIELELKLGYKIERANPRHYELLTQLLLPDDEETRQLLQQMQNPGQIDPGLITTDGRIINSNRRYAAKKKLNQSTMLVAILPSSLTAQQLFDIEFDLQVTGDYKKEYKGINRLFMIRRALELGKTHADFKKDHNISSKVINRDMMVLEKIELFLEEIDEEGNYGLLSNMLEHFFDYVKEIEKIEANNGDLFSAEETFFALMKINIEETSPVIAHKDIRDTLFYASIDPKIAAVLTRNLDSDNPNANQNILDDVAIAKSLAKARKDNESILKTIGKLRSQISGINVTESQYILENQGHLVILKALQDFENDANKFVQEVTDETNKQVRIAEAKMANI